MFTVMFSFVASSVLIHVAVLGGTRLVEWLALVALAVVPFSIALLELRWRAWLAFAALLRRGLVAGRIRSADARCCTCRRC